jgi:hypothetical protein
MRYLREDIADQEERKGASMTQITDERLGQIVAETHWQLTLVEQRKAAIELLAYRRSGAVEALRGGLGLLLDAGLNEECKTSWDFKIGKQIRTAIAKLEAAGEPSGR